MRRYVLAFFMALMSVSPMQAAAQYDCKMKTGVPRLEDLTYGGSGSSMHDHVEFATCIASAMSVGNFASAGWFAENKLGLRTNGGIRSNHFGYHEPSQKLWEKGYLFRKQASLFVSSAKAAAAVKTPENEHRAYVEYIELLSRCHDCHQTPH